MSNTPRLNWFVFAAFALISAAVFGAAIALPSFRLLAYAPVRELVLPKVEAHGPITAGNYRW